MDKERDEDALLLVRLLVWLLVGTTHVSASGQGAGEDGRTVGRWAGTEKRSI